MESDYLGLSVQIRQLLKQIDDTEMDQNSKILHDILDTLGGLKNTLLLILNSVGSKNIISWYQLHELQTILLSSQHVQSDENVVIYNNKTNTSLNVLNIHTDCINNIYKYLSLTDHANLSMTCSYLLSIGRCHTSFNCSKDCYEFGIIPKLPQYVINFKNNNQINEFIKCVDVNNCEHYDLSPILYCGIFDELMEMSNIKDDINIKNEQNYNTERQKYFIFNIMKSAIVSSSNIMNRTALKFNIETIAENYCKNYCANNPPSPVEHDYDDQNPYYKNAQIAMTFLKWQNPIATEITKYVCRNRIENRRRDSSAPIIHLSFEDPEIYYHYEKLKNRDLEDELERVLNVGDALKQDNNQLNARTDQLMQEINVLQITLSDAIESKAQLAVECVKEIDRYSKIINGLLQIPHLKETVKLVLNSH